MELTGTILGEWKQRALPAMIERELDLASYARLQPPKITVLTAPPELSPVKDGDTMPHRVPVTDPSASANRIRNPGVPPV